MCPSVLHTILLPCETLYTLINCTDFLDPYDVRKSSGSTITLVTFDHDLGVDGSLQAK